MNTELKKVFVVTRGEYSDRCNHGVYSTRALAEAAGGDVEEWILDNDPTRPDHLRQFSLLMTRNGEVIQTFMNTLSGPVDDGARAVTLEFYGVCRWFSVYGKDLQHAIKIANERRIQLLAFNSWEK